MIYIEKGFKLVDWDKLENVLELLRDSEEATITVECLWYRGKVKSKDANSSKRSRYRSI